jgi:7,8-dihydro-6-hydroxymethylpterin dimethyltransferase
MGMTSHEAPQTIEREKLAETISVCPVCLKRIKAKRVAYGSDVYLEKKCPDHGHFSTILWRGQPGYPSWFREKIPNHPRQPLTSVDKGCPFDCGLCSNHRQEPCCVLLEVTQRCDLGCPVCFASAGETESTDPSLDVVRMWYQRMLDAGGPYNIQLSGGEPCLRDDLAEIIQIGREMGFTYFQVNTNGRRIASDSEFLESLKDAGLNVVYMQFDGTEDEINRQLRGRDLFDIKKKAIENCRQAELGVVLVPTIHPKVNAHNLGQIIHFALENYPTVRSIHLQPQSFFGRYPTSPENSDRITIPELLQKMEEQTRGLVHKDDFSPKGSENSYCSFHGTFVIMPDGSLKPIKPKQAVSCCDKPENAREGLQKSKQFVARNWAFHKTISNSKPSPSLGGWDDLLERAQTHLFSISGMAFQDAWNLDLELLQDCCIEVASADGTLVPFCAYNLTDTQGRAIYRPTR